MKRLIAVLALLLLASVASAQTTEQKGWGINPNFTIPLQFGENAQGQWVALPSVGLAAEVGWKDVLTTNGEQSLKYSAGAVFEGNIAQSAGTTNSVTDGIVGLELGYKEMTLIGGYQGLGSPLTGPGGSRWILSVNYNFASLLGGWTFF